MFGKGFEERRGLPRTEKPLAHTGYHASCGSGETKHIKSHLKCRFDPSRARLSCSLGFPASNHPCR